LTVTANNNYIKSSSNTKLNRQIQETI